MPPSDRDGPAVRALRLALPSRNLRARMAHPAWWPDANTRGGALTRVRIPRRALGNVGESGVVGSCVIRRDIARAPEIVGTCRRHTLRLDGFAASDIAACRTVRWLRGEQLIELRLEVLVAVETALLDRS